VQPRSEDTDMAQVGLENARQVELLEVTFARYHTNQVRQSFRGCLEHEWLLTLRTLIKAFARFLIVRARYLSNHEYGSLLPLVDNFLDQKEMKLVLKTYFSCKNALCTIMGKNLQLKER